ncbi:Mat- sexual cell fertilization-promoting factor [Cytospora mali]|uniref:Mat-sexual cell fertilization-promoting factor n=1 Tax=Cytospora mali TaxID=578113 RepID=A0A194W9K4_CYTMA|nr:Mat- sexual cell fertilization-promoting factor [Valsa mali]
MADTMFRMPPVVAQVFGGPSKVHALLDNQHKVKNGKVGKAKTVQGVRKAVKSRRPHVPKKKGVNNFLLFRRMAMMLFHNLPQSERSPIIRVMWEKERHKSSWALMARVWTFIRDNSEYDNIWQYLCCAIDLIRTVPPEAWLATYNMLLVEANDGSMTLRQYAEPACIRAPRDLSDFELLKGVVMRGLAVEDPEGLLRKMLQHANHLMTITTMAAEVSTDDTAKADDAFVNSMTYDPIATFAELLGLPANANAFDFGVNVIDVEDVTNFDDSLVNSIGNHTHLRYQFANSTAHIARPDSGSLDLGSQEANTTFDLGVPEQWQNIDGQISQSEYQTITGVVQNNAPDYIMGEDFANFIPSYDLQ